MRIVKTVELPKELSVVATDEPSHGGANHVYEVHTTTDSESFCPCQINFQKGPILEEGISGVTELALLAVLIDRLQSFQKGHFACRENALALTKLEEAVHWMQARTKNRELRGVEGTSKQ